LSTSRFKNWFGASRLFMPEVEVESESELDVELGSVPEVA
jgi:hypothetical protein